MKNVRTVIWATLMALLAGLWYSGIASGQEAESDDETITLSSKLSRKVAQIVTPSDILPDRNRWRSGGVDTIRIIGKSMIIHVDVANDRIGLDMDGDGSIGSKEWTVLASGTGGLEAAFKIPLDSEDRRTDYVGVLLKDISMFVNKLGGEIRVVLASGRMVPVSCMEGKLNGKYIRLFDDNLDGRFTQDGRDAISIGRTGTAIPLLATHKIDDTFYRLQVVADGTSVTFTPQHGVVVAEVAVPIKTRALEALILSDGQQAYDLTVTNEIPPGSYKLVYGLLKSGMTMIPPDESEGIEVMEEAVTYEIQAGMVNNIQIGVPLWLAFYTTVEGGAFSIGAYSFRVFGIGGEEYLIDIDTTNASPPVITVSVDGKDVSTGTMEVGYGRFGFYDGQVPSNVGDTTVVTVTTNIAGMGEAIGKATWAEMLAHDCQLLLADEPVIYEPVED